MGPLPQGKRQVKFLLVAIDYFIKWVEAEAYINNHRGEDPELCVEKHSLQVWHTKDDNIRQWSSIQQLGIQDILLKTRNQEPILFTRTPTTQQTDKRDESNIAKDHQSSTRRGKGCMTRGITKCPVGL